MGHQTTEERGVRGMEARSSRLSLGVPAEQEILSRKW